MEVPQPFQSQYYFLYGSLMDQSTLARVIKRPHRPELIPARIVRYRLKLWGAYPALLDGSEDAVVIGMAYEVRSLSEQRYLEAYESDYYVNSPCVIELEGGKAVVGRTFKWAVDQSLLRDGAFDLRDWQLDSIDTR
ncbi:hypothetical protein ASPWEDRAFT_174726 [Aspergillus wentii DTO 134E9]|uniref:Putative gamma-glutamylcyclotransferase n=1 Tax=Aspergillus wentii DTO 134E9 TaxID=1073089 RepID=A0A1L9REH1_ASPWE|nr:uncharacterized protein ASPWEDRAFT_174726 [Aspergillus wentii DTO 134E9]OJJ33316.1 hypothetical protein ASPWEDRAFT_174726 [Aspergillus wentii DTO 134E9]